MSDAQQVLNTSISLMELALNAVEKSTAAFANLVEMFGNEREGRIIKKELNDGKHLMYTALSEVDPQKLSAFEKDLKINGVPYVKGQDEHGRTIITYTDKHKDDVQAITSKNFPSPERMPSNQPTRIINHLSQVEAALMQQHANEYGVIVDVHDGGNAMNAGYNVTYMAIDNDKMDKIKKMTAVELSGEGGKALSKQIEYECEKYTRLHDEIFADKIKEPFYIVDTNGESMYVDNNKVQFHGRKNDGQITERTAANEKYICSNYYILMDNPVKMSVDEYNEFQKLTKDEKKEMLVNKDIEYGRPQLTKEEYIELKKLEKNRDLMYKKLDMAVDNNRVYSYDFTNDDIRLATFREDVEINERDYEQTLDELEPEIYNEAETMAKRFNENDEVDRIGQSVRARNRDIVEGRFHEVDDIIDQMNDRQNMIDEISDRNANFINDVYEN